MRYKIVMSPIKGCDAYAGVQKSLYSSEYFLGSDLETADDKKARKTLLKRS